MYCMVRHVGPITVLDVHGRVAFGDGAMTVQSALSRQLELGVKRLIVNLAWLKSIDQTGIGQLVACSNAAHATCVVVKLVRPSGSAYDLLNLATIEEVFDVYQNEAEALASFALPLDAPPARAASSGFRGADGPRTRDLRGDRFGNRIEGPA
jgi:anti-sigma B factor antagonist